ncbi:MAG: Ku protein [Candidatus Babeliaceae bacterium]
MKTIWKGSISFGLISIAVELFSAIQQRVINFTLLHTTCHSPLHYKRWCPVCKKEVSWQDTVKGIKLSDDTYFIITKQNLEKLKQEKTDILQLIGGIGGNEINPLYLNQHYYLLPQKGAEHAYFLLSAALEKLNKYAIGQFVLHEKEHLCILRPHEKILLLTTLHYHDEIRPFPEKLLPKEQKITQQELELAQLLLQKLSTKKVNISAFKDTFAAKLHKLMQEKPRKIKTKTPIKRKSARKTKHTPSLMESLRASLKAPSSLPAHKGR